MFIKIDANGYILSHSYSQSEEYSIEAKVEVKLLDNDLWGYKHKYVEGALVELTEEEILNQPQYLSNLASQARTLRDSKLAECDYIVLSDSQASVECKAAFATYRQALRNISEQETFPMVAWPSKPEYQKAE